MPGAWDKLTSSYPLHLEGPEPVGGFSIEVYVDWGLPPESTAYLDSMSVHQEDENIIFRDGADTTTLCPAL